MQKKDNTENKEMVKVESGFITSVNSNLESIMAEELEGMEVSFDRVKIPAGGALYFELPLDDPENPETLKEVTGVILHHHALNSYYKDKYTGGSNPPDCGSFDGKVGEGTPGGQCLKCPLNQFGSGENGSGKACKNKRRIYLLREGEIFPILLTLPTGSLKEFTNYIAKRIVAKGKRSFGVVTKVTLKKAVNSGGITYSQAVFSIDRDLKSEEIEAMSKVSEKIKESTKAVSFDYDADIEGEEFPFN